jgi:trehalose 6-phosphate synthase
LVSNRVIDLQGAAGGGVAVALPTSCARGALWFGWNGEIKAEGEADLVEREGRLATVKLSATEHQGYYLGYSNSVLWPVFHNRLDVAQFEAGFFDQYVDVNKRLAELLQPLLRADDVIWVHDYHLIPFAAELRRRGVENAIGFYLTFPSALATFMAIPSISSSPARLRLRPYRVADQGRRRQSSTTWPTARTAASCPMAASACSIGFCRWRASQSAST